MGRGRRAVRPGGGVAELLEVRGVRKHFPIRSGLFSRVTGSVKAVDGVDLKVPAGRTLGLVGESGCGKTTLSRCILRLIEPTAGEVLYEGRDLLKLNARAMRAARRHVQIIFQDPYTSLNPRMSVGSIVGEPLSIHKIARGAERRKMVADLLATVGLEPTAMSKYPHEFSGGQRQRIGIARALALKPSFIVADEPVSSLDVSIQAQILNLMIDLQEQRGIAYLFIAHDLRVVEKLADNVAVMYLGRIVEQAPTSTLFAAPLHPYTQALLEAIPTVDPATRRQRLVVPGDLPSPAAPPPGCHFHPRCPVAVDACRQIEPPLLTIAPGHQVACHLVKPEQAQTPSPAASGSRA